MSGAIPIKFRFIYDGPMGLIMFVYIVYCTKDTHICIQLVYTHRSVYSTSRGDGLRAVHGGARDGG